MTEIEIYPSLIEAGQIKFVPDVYTTLATTMYAGDTKLLKYNGTYAQDALHRTDYVQFNEPVLHRTEYIKLNGSDVHDGMYGADYTNFNMTGVESGLHREYAYENDESTFTLVMAILFCIFLVVLVIIRIFKRCDRKS